MYHRKLFSVCSVTSLNINQYWRKGVRFVGLMDNNFANCQHALAQRLLEMLFLNPFTLSAIFFTQFGEKAALIENRKFSFNNLRNQPFVSKTSRKYNNAFVAIEHIMMLRQSCIDGNSGPMDGAGEIQVLNSQVHLGPQNVIQNFVWVYCLWQNFCDNRMKLGEKVESQFTELFNHH